MKIKKSSISIFIISFILIMNEGAFYLFSEKTTMIIKNVLYLLSVLIFYAIIMMLRKKWNIFNFKYEILFLILLIIISPFNTYRIYGQEVSVGYKLILCYFMYLNYFLVSNYITTSKSNKEKLDKVLVYISVVVSVFYLIQYKIYPKIILNGLGYRINFRFYQPRFYVTTILFVISFFYCTIKLFFGEKKSRDRKVYFLGFILNLLVITVVTKTRTIMVAVACCFMLLVFLKFRKTNIVKSLFLLIGTVILIGCIFNSEIMKNMIELSKTDDISISQRLNEISFFMEQLKESPLLGRGEVHKSMYPYISGEINKMYLDDLGVLGIAVKYGVMSLIIISIIAFKIARIILKEKEDKQSKYWLIAVYIYIIISGAFIPYLDNAESILYISVLLAYTDNLKLNQRRMLR